MTALACRCVPRRAPSMAAVVIAALALVPGAARAVMDINDRGPVLNASGYTLRVTNIGALGNAFFDVGLSSDPSFEYPRGSGNELLKHAELWVGALDEEGRGRVSGGPLTEWRPTLADDDRVHVGWRGRLGSRRGIDDDGDGQIDEERFNGRDDDGDGEVDEDLAFPSDEVAASDYRDDQPEAINYGYPNGEVHHPFGLEVHEEDYAWSLPGYEGIAGIQYVITNRSDRTVRGLYVGLLADLDSRTRDQATGHLDDKVVQRTATRTFADGSWFVTVNGAGPQVPSSCFRTVTATVPVVVDADSSQHLPAVTVIGLGHTTDALALIDVPVARQAARAPGRESFRYQRYRTDLPPGQGGLPVLDADRYSALQGGFPQNLADVPGDQATLVSCGPFSSLAPGQSIEFAVALCAAPDADSLVATLRNAITLQRGFVQNRLPDSTGTEYNVGATGKSGHEVCLEPPPGVSFDWDPNCPAYWALTINADVPEIPVHFEHGHCVWTNADCDPCTGINGFETRVHWLDPGSVPPSPAYVATPGDHRVNISWDNMPEVLLQAHIVGAGGYNFSGYRVYRLSDWRGRRALLPPPERWEEIGAFGPDSLNGQRPLSAVTDSTVDYDLIRFGQKHYPVGRYRLVDDRVLNGFDYIYIVTALASREVVAGSGATITERIESPLVTSLDSLVVPHVTAAASAGRVWVVPNPYRDSSPWDRPRVPGDEFGRHVDFMGLPRARCTIKIWTLAGDLVAQLDHDGSRGDGQAPWNLISRNGQDVESGIYLFTVDSPLGKQIGKFVLIR